jgi:hypothetical protein
MGNIVTLATSITANTDESCTLTVANLETLISNAGDTYFADSANWSNVRIEYRSSTGRQREMVVMTPASPSGIFKVSEKARQEQWNIEKIVISDFDGDFYVVKKADMAPTDYDEPTISAVAPPPSGNYPFVADLNDPGTFGVYQFATNGGGFDFLPSGGVISYSLSNETFGYTFISNLSPAGEITTPATIRVTIQTANFNPSFGSFTGRLRVFNQAETSNEFITQFINGSSGTTVFDIPTGSLTNVGKIIFDTQFGITLDFDITGIQVELI